MIEITCPNCGHTFEEDDTKYQGIIQQIRDQEFEKELRRRMEPMDEARRQAVAAARSEAAAAERAKIASEQQEAARRNAEELTSRDSRIAALEQQLKGERSEAEARRRADVAAKEARIAALEQQIRSQQETAASAQALAVANARSESQAASAELERRLLLERQKAERLEGELDRQKEALARQKEDSQRATKELLDLKDAEIERLRDFKQQLSTKMLGETLEQHCQNEFNRLRTTAFRTATFEKDNAAVAGEDGRATKGDYIFRDFDEEGHEFVSIMFDMKNEADEGASKRTNESHLKKLDADRRKKGCEYAVLVSTLEPNSDLYNQGIVDVSYLYPKMYVIRPQFFVPLITLLRDANRQSLDLRRELAKARAESIDITNFEAALAEFQSGFSRNVENASKRFDKAMDDIDSAIRLLERIKESFRLTQRHLNAANSKADSLSIKRLTRDSPLLAERFEELHREQAEGKSQEGAAPADGTPSEDAGASGAGETEATHA
ncbi:MAG: DUF2130 domain-containing protein [Atopobiaceae bacterium]|jgi:hypothetical protein|nr:DUF2130 domain-containing protein [Atopobiaceae bacterium]MCH4120016.1 DUF2130 domain-containing protein [Atopobiaceae bacterium]MCI1318910.1 DUF2130 domain-containing protein [Atopobiaceae bacterium]MCI1389375.1 DUF2130 domain-containing protein [Atopobiaceae bacterium]MCI1432438.1 DUF2130 domain-containing protein [Atopobiaceae bacterium]